ncbi:MAG: Hsp20/alpha crystallin family protein [Nevskia sp.]|nr:Hsp20/alpha crystallin family protein [Nevskia sp.]
MWAEACELLDRADRLHRQFFHPGLRAASRPNWEPPVDMFETERALWLIVALPGVAVDQVDLSIDGTGLVVAAIRALPQEARGAAIRRLEIPAGRFERRIELPPGRFELVERRFADGCLTLGLRKLPSSAAEPWSHL